MPRPHRGMEHIMGLLKIKIHKGVNLVVRDVWSSDPYVVVRMGSQELKTRVVKQNVNPEWNDELTLSIIDPNLPVRLLVYDHDVLSLDDKMGDAEFHIGPFLEAVNMRLGPCQSGTVISRVQPSRDNCYAEESCIVWKDGRVVQQMVLRLQHIDHGEVELEIHWVDIPGAGGLAL